MLLINNDELREKMGEPGRELIENEFSWRLIATKLLN
jgi:glycosyltransferase involved in cell wall biosynthesis